MRRLLLLGVAATAVLLPLGCLEKGDEAAREAGPPAVRAAQCRWADRPITIDGNINKRAWAKAEVLQDFSAFWQKRKARSKTTARLLWNSRYLFFCADMEDTDLFADVKEPNGITWENDVFELFFKPVEDKLPYYEFQVNAANTPLELFLPSRGSGGYRRFAKAGPLGMESAVKLQGTLNKWEDTDKGWTVEGRIPWTAFKATGGRPKPGDKWRFALCRYDYSKAYDRPDLSSTAPLTYPDFHRYEDYGVLTFVGPEE
jgi:hypothetical protein